jgi:hypothetical protein
MANDFVADQDRVFFLPDDMSLATNVVGIEVGNFNYPAEFDGAKQQSINTVLPFTVAINQDFGGEGAPVELLGYSTGIYPMSASRPDFDGATLFAIPSANIFASEDYGSVGGTRRAQVQVEQYATQNFIYTLPDAQAFETFITPGFSGE